MQTTSLSKSPSRWIRFIPRQFSFGAMLGLMTVVGGVLWWNTRLPEGTITQAQADAFCEMQANAVFEITKAEVKSRIGEPEYKRGDLWVYSVRESSPSADINLMLLVAFGRNEQIEWVEQVRKSTAKH